MHSTPCMPSSTTRPLAMSCFLPTRARSVKCACPTHQKWLSPSTDRQLLSRSSTDSGEVLSTSTTPARKVVSPGVRHSGGQSSRIPKHKYYNFLLHDGALFLHHNKGEVLSYAGALELLRLLIKSAYVGVDHHMKKALADL